MQTEVAASVRIQTVTPVHSVMKSGNASKVGIGTTEKTTHCARRLRKCEITKRMVAVQIVFVQKAHGQVGMRAMGDYFAIRVLPIHTNPMFWTSH